MKKPHDLPNQSDKSELPAVSQRCRWLLRVRGIVQGVGFRPFIYNTARALGLAGWVKNTSGQVDILVEGPSGQLESFVQAIRENCPPQ
ncbi:MAG TPA: acylphosphatase, partial [Thermoguttaceae bacterium]|nr:acylphosphatase [Thermoguttaceae bacterium]